MQLFYAVLESIQGRIIFEEIHYINLINTLKISRTKLIEAIKNSKIEINLSNTFIRQTSRRSAKCQMPNTSGAVNWVNVFFIDKRQQHDSEINVSFKKARKNVIGDGVKIIFHFHLNFYAAPILKLLGDLLTLLVGIF